MLADDLPLDFSKKADDLSSEQHSFARHSPSPSTKALSSLASPASLSPTNSHTRSSPTNFGRLLSETDHQNLKTASLPTTSIYPSSNQSSANTLNGLSALAQLSESLANPLNSISSFGPALNLSGLLSSGQSSFGTLNSINFQNLANSMGNLNCSTSSSVNNSSIASNGLPPATAAAVSNVAAVAAAAAASAAANGSNINKSSAINNPLAGFSSQQWVELLNSMSTKRGIGCNESLLTQSLAGNNLGLTENASALLNGITSAVIANNTSNISGRRSNRCTKQMMETDLHSSGNSSTSSSSSLLLSPGNSRSSMCSPTGSAAGSEMDTSQPTANDHQSSSSASSTSSEINSSMINSGPTSSIVSISGMTTPSVNCSLSSSSSINNNSGRKRGKPIPDDLKDDTYWERRRKNNEAAKRSRDAKRAKEEETSMRASLLEQENLQLRIHVAKLREENQMLKSILNIEHVDPTTLQQMALTPQSLSP